MSSVEQTLINHWKTLTDPSSTKQAKCVALTYFRSTAGNDALSQMVEKKQYIDLCKIIIEMIGNEDEELSSDASKTVKFLVNDAKYKDVNLYHVGLHMNRKKKLKFFQFVEKMEITTLLNLSQNDDAIKFINDCMQTVDEKIMEWLSPTSCRDNIKLLSQAEQRKKAESLDTEDLLVTKAMKLLHRMYEEVSKNMRFNAHHYHVFLLEKIIQLAYMGLKFQRFHSLNLLNIAMQTDFILYVQEFAPRSWLQFKDNLQKIYCIRMGHLVKAGEQDWARQWTLSIQLLGIQLHRGAELINDLLGIEEKAFKSSDQTIRKEAFVCWKLLIDNFALNPAELASSRRIKLLCIPLNAKNSKTETLSLTKLDVWWHLIIKLDPGSTEFVQQVLGGFLEFCFGPLGDTPLLSTQVDLVASPGKRFPKTRALAVDALLQLLVRRRQDRLLINSGLKEKLPQAITNTLFKIVYKRILHSVGEALILISNLTDNDLKNREKLCNILWSNLVEYIEESPEVERLVMFKELILVISEITSHIDDSPLISNLIVNTIIPELAELPNHQLVYNDDTLINLAKKLLSPGVLIKVETRHLDGIKTIACQAIKPKNRPFYSNTLGFINSVLTHVENKFTNQLHSSIYEIWCMFTGLVIKYMSEDLNINESKEMTHDFVTIYKVLNFPFKCPFWQGIDQLRRVAVQWAKVYKLFYKKTEMISTVKPNEIADTITIIIRDSSFIEKRCYRLAAYCLEPLNSTIDYRVFLDFDFIPSIINLLREVTINSLSELPMQCIEVELSLKAMTTALMTVFRFAKPGKTLLYLEMIVSSIELMLTIDPTFSTGNTEKEIVNTWDTFVMILRGLGKYISNRFLSIYNNAIKAAFIHKNPEIVTLVKSMYKINELREEAKILLSDLEKKAYELLEINSATDVIQNPIIIATESPKTFIINTVDVIKKPIICEPGKIRKPIKMVGSYLGRNPMIPKLTSTPRIIAPKKNNEIKKMVTLPFNEKSQEYKIINSNIKIDINCFTEHQKESFKRKRDDILALDNDVSQSASRDTQDLQEWFDEKRRKTIDNENSVEKENQDHQVASSSVDISHEINKIPDEKKIEAMETDHTENKSETVPTSEITLPDKEFDPANDSTTSTNNLSDGIAKKLDFESREEYPDENENTDDKQMNSKELQKNEMKAPGHIKDKEEEEMQNQEKKGRGRGRPTRALIKPKDFSDLVDKNLKRKATSDNESEPVEKKRRRRTASDQNFLYDTSDSESIYSTESENQTSISQDLLSGNEKNLSEQTKRELLRLQINMVSESYLPGRRRSKITDELDSSLGKKGTIEKPSKNRFSKGEKEEESQELTKNRRKRVPKINQDYLKPEEISPSGRRRKIIDSKDSDKANSSLEDMSDKSSNVDPTDELIEHGKNDQASEEEKKEEDDDEIVESSQNTLALRSPKRFEKRLSKLNSPSTRSSNTPQVNKSIIASILDTDETCFDENTQTTATQSRKKSPEKTRQPAVSVNSSPKTSKVRISSTRTSQIMNLIKGNLSGPDKEALLEKSTTNQVESPVKKNKNKETDIDSPIARKDRQSVINQPDRISSPSGSRQEKIFNNMRSNEMTTSGPSSLFSNLKNNGEKISPKMGKTLITSKSHNTDDAESNKNDEEDFAREEDELEFLEWSAANPPSLTASPSVSILKRQKNEMTPDTSDIETTPSRRKRASFADPLVSRRAIYHVAPSLKPTIPRIISGKRDTPMKLKLAKFKKIQIDSEKSEEPSRITVITETSSKQLDDNHVENLTENEINCQNEFSKEPADVLQDDRNFDSDTDENIEDLPIVEDQMEMTDKSENISNKSNHSDISLDLRNSQQDVDVNDSLRSNKSKDTLANSFDPSCYRSLGGKFKQSMDLFDPECQLSGKNKLNDSGLLSSSQSIDGNSIPDCFKLRMNDDTAVAKMLCERTLKKGLQASMVLDDTVDIRNISRINSTTGSDDGNFEKPTSTSTIVIAECDTLPVTESMIISQNNTQENQKSHTSINKESSKVQPPVICPILLGCEEPISTIVAQLTNPYYIGNLSNYFVLNNIKTIGDLAKSSEKEVSCMPVKGLDRVQFIKSILTRFAKSHKYKIEGKNKNASSIVLPENTCSHGKKNPEIIDETINEQTTQEQSCKNSDVIKQSNELISSIDTIQSLASPPRLERQDLQETDDYGSMIIDTSISPPKKSSTEAIDSKKSTTPKQTETVISPQSLSKQLSPTQFKELDLDVIVQHVVKKCSLEQILTRLKTKMEHLSKEEQFNEIMKIFEINDNNDEKLNNYYQKTGLRKVLLQLPGIFSSEKNFYSEVLETYKMHIKPTDCINTLTENAFKKALCKSYTSSELCDLLASALKEEKHKGIKLPTKSQSGLKCLERFTIDSIITDTLGNDKVISTDAAADKIIKQAPKIAQQVFNNMMTPETLVNSIDKCNMTKEQLLTIYKSISMKLNSDDLLAGFTEIVKTRMK